MQESIFHEFVDLHDGSFITTAVAIIRCREHGNDVPIMRPVVTIHNQLMSSGYQFEIIAVIELLRNVLSERVAGTSGRDSPTTSIIRVGP